MEREIKIIGLNFHGTVPIGPIPRSSAAYLKIDWFGPIEVIKQQQKSHWVLGSFW